jgi:hypothetical protein
LAGKTGLCRSDDKKGAHIDVAIIPAVAAQQECSRSIADATSSGKHFPDTNHRESETEMTLNLQR